MKLVLRLGIAVVIAVAGCTGQIGGVGSTSGSGSTGGGSTGGDPGSVTPPPPPFEPATAASSVRKVKNLLTGMTPTDDEIALATAQGAQGLQTLIDGWTADPTLQPMYRDRMVAFFRNTFQQTGFNPAEDFKPQLLTNGGFDFAATPGDDIFQRLVQNIQDSFAMTAWQLIADGRPFNEVLTTNRFMMTTALKATYLQIEMPRSQAATTIAWKVDESGNDIPIEQIVDPTSPNYLTFGDVAPTLNNRAPTIVCRGTAGMVNSFNGFSTLFQVMLGLIPQYSTTAAGVTTDVCDRHSSRPYFTLSDVSDWQWVSVRALAAGETRVMPYNLPALRQATELALALPRVGFYTTPAFLALWNTNDSNQHRVTANQTLLIALGASLTPASSIVPLSAAGLDPSHATTGTECYGCHKTLDPLRQFWGTQLDFNDRNDFPAKAGGGLAADPRPAMTGGALAYSNVNATGADMTGLGPLLEQVVDLGDPKLPVSRFALAMAQKLCYFANSAPCVETDPELRRIASLFEKQRFQLPGADARDAVVAAGDRRGLDRDRDRQRIQHQHRASRPAVRGAVEPARQARPVRPGGADPVVGAVGDAEDRDQHPRRRLQPRQRGADHRLDPDAVLFVGVGAAVRERRRPRGRRDDRCDLQQHHGAGGDRRHGPARDRLPARRSPLRRRRADPAGQLRRPRRRQGQPHERVALDIRARLRGTHNAFPGSLEKGTRR